MISMMRWMKVSIEPAVVAGNAAQQDAQEETDRDAEEANEEGGARAIHQARPQIAPQRVGAEQEQHLLGLGALDRNQMAIHCFAEQCPFKALAEEDAPGTSESGQSRRRA